MLKLKLHWQILIAILIACLAGTLTAQDTSIFGVSLYVTYDFIGSLFLNALRMIMVPLIMASIIMGISGISASGNLGRLGGKTLVYYLASSFIAILTGLVLVNLIQPGILAGAPAGQQLGLAENLGQIIEKVEGRGISDLAAIFLRMVPTNIVAAAAEGQMLGLIFFSLVFGFFMTRIDKGPANSLQNFWQGVFQTMMKVTLWVMSFAPIGVFGLVAKTVTATGFSAFVPLLSFFLTVLLALAYHTFITLPLVLKFIAHVNPWRHFRAMSTALLTAFSTASSSATLPMTLKCIEENAGVSNRTSSFVLPLGATVNMDGTALYECVAAIFIAQAYGLELTFATQFTIVLVALLTSIGVAGIPAASLVAITIILTAIGLPIEAIGLILVTDRILDMCRTAVNIFSDSCGTVVIAKSEGEDKVLAE